jgi:hypothetical protein
MDHGCDLIFSSVPLIVIVGAVHQLRRGGGGVGGKRVHDDSDSDIGAGKKKTCRGAISSPVRAGESKYERKQRRQREKYGSQTQDGLPATDGESKEGRSKRKNKDWKRETRARKRLQLTSLGGDDEVAEEE